MHDKSPNGHKKPQINYAILKEKNGRKKRKKKKRRKKNIDGVKAKAFKLPC